MNRRFFLSVCGFLVLALLLPFQAMAAAGGSETLLNRFGGTILDFDGSRIVWEQSGNKALWQYDRTNGKNVKIYDAAGSDYDIGKARLTTEGVVFSLDGSPMLTQYWTNGTVRRIAEGKPFYDAKGNFAVIGDKVANVTTGESRSLPSKYFLNGGLDLSANGMAVYTSPTYISNLYQSFPDGTTTTSVPPSPNYYTYSGALTDGKSTLYQVHHVVWSQLFQVVASRSRRRWRDYLARH